MIVQTLRGQYNILRVLHTGNGCESSLAQDEAGETCLLVCFRESGQNRAVLPLLARARDLETFTDDQGLFSREGRLYARFAWTQAPLLRDRLARGDLSFRERLTAAGSLLERMTLLNMPLAIQLEALRDRNLTLSDALAVRFNYVLEDLPAGMEKTMKDLADRVRELLTGLFAQELSAKGVPELEAYLKALETQPPKTYLELYSGFDAIRRQLLDRVTGEKPEPRTWLFRLWDKIKGLRRFLWPVLSGIVLITAFCYLVYTLLLPPRPKGAPVVFEEIGTVEIQQLPSGGRTEPVQEDQEP